MALELHHLVELVALTLGYWWVDLLIRRGHLGRWMRPEVAFVVGCIVALPAAVVLPWSLWPQGDALRVLVVVVASALVWKATTKDFDIVVGEKTGALRLGLVALCVVLWWSPTVLPVVLLTLTTPFGLWQHHATLPMRVLQAVLAWMVLVCGVWGLGGAGLALPLGQNTAVLLWFVVTIQVSHYLITALAKMWLGPRVTSWVTDNTLHHLAASAYSWGWMRWLPWSRWRRVIAAVRMVEIPMQLAAFTVELLAPLALAHGWAAVGMSVVWSSFHVGVFALSGLLFWDWIVTNLAVAAALLWVPEQVWSTAFGGWQLLATLIFMVAFPLRHKLWTPMPLGWWDTPLTQRIHWVVTGGSGQEYALTNAFMCPHERLFGKVNGCFLAPEAVFTYHLGEVWKHDLRDAIREAGPDMERLKRVREKYGILPRSEALVANHVAYLTRFLGLVNRGVVKHALPQGLRWLKAPGGQIFYWNELPRFYGQERVVKVSLWYREEYFDGEELVRLTNTHVLDIDIDDSAADVEPVSAPSPKEMDDFLLDFAVGKLIDLPDFGEGYVKTDDGAARAVAAGSSPDS